MDSKLIKGEFEFSDTNPYQQAEAIQYKADSNIDISDVIKDLDTHHKMKSYH